MGFWALIFLLLALVGSALYLARSARGAGRDDVLADQGKAAGKARRDAQEAERRVDGMSDNDAADKLRNEWSRD